MKYSEQVKYIAIIMMTTLLGALMNDAHREHQEWQENINEMRNLFGNPDFISPEVVNIPLSLTRNMPTVKEFVKEAHAEEKDATQTAKLKEAPEKKYSVEDDIRQVFGDKAEEAIKVAKCESGLRAVSNEGLNKNGSVDAGVFQVNQSAHRVAKKWLMNSAINIRIAKQLYDEQGWNPWYSSKKCHGLSGK